MDLLLGKVTQQAMNYAIRSGVTLTATYALRQSTKLLNNAPKSNIRDQLLRLQQRLEHKIRIISPAIDMIELIAARGNTSLESAVSLTKELRLDIQQLGQRLASAATASEKIARSSRPSTRALTDNEEELFFIVDDIKKLLERIEDAVPLINLAITTSGASLSTSLPKTVSPSRLLQASTFLTAGDTQFSLSPRSPVQIGPTFTLTVYMLFAGHDRPANEEDLRETTWKEVIHKARVKLRRVPLDLVAKTGSGSDALQSAEIEGDLNPQHDPNSQIPANARADEYGYQLMIIEDFDDDRVHDFEQDQAQPGPFDDVRLAGIREMIPIHEVSKIFYADTSKVLNIGTEGETNHPVLLLKRDTNAVPPRRMVERDGPVTEEEEEEEDDQNDQTKTEAQQQYVEDDHADRNRDPWRLPASLDPEWIAFEVYSENTNDDSASESESFEDAEQDISDPSATNLTNSMAKLDVQDKAKAAGSQLITREPPPWVNAIKTSLSMLELLLRLTSLQQFQQQSHLSITDELLNFFLEESASTGAGGDEHYRQAVRADARRRVGWDPYDESPLKRRGEDYQYQYYNGGASQQGTPRTPYDNYDEEEYGGGGGGGRGSTGRRDRGSMNGPGGEGGGWNSPDGRTQTRSNTGVSNSPSPMGSPVPGKQRAEWLKKQDERRGSPLRPRTGVSDEGLGTSPASGAGSGVDYTRM